MGNNLLQSIGDNMQFVLVCAVVIAAILAVSELMERTILKDNIGHPGKTHTITILWHAWRTRRHFVSV